MKNRFLCFFWAISIVLTAKHTARSQSTLYYDAGQFYAASRAVSGNWQSISLLDLPSDEIGPSLNISDMTFTGRYLVRHYDPDIGSAGVLYNFDSDIPLSIHFANGTRAFGANFSSLLSPGYSSFTATVSLDNGETFTFSAPTNPNSAFFGFISPIPIMDMTFSDGGLFGFGNLHEELLGNVIVVTVPEPSVLALFALGGFLLAIGQLRLMGSNRELSSK